MFTTSEFQQFLKALCCEFYKLPKTDSDEKLRQIALQRNKEQAKKIIKDSRGVERDGWIHHMLAKERYWLDLIGDLLEAEHDPNLEAPDGLTALDLALKRNVELRWVEALVQSGAIFGRAARSIGWWRSLRSYQNGDLQAFTRIIRVLSSTQKNRLQEPNQRAQNALDWYLSAKEELPLQEIDVLLQSGLRMSQPRETMEAAFEHRPLIERNLAWLRAAVGAGFSREYWNIFSLKERFVLRLAQDLLDNPQRRATPLIEAIIHKQTDNVGDSWSSANSTRLSDGTTPLMLALYPKPQENVVRGLLNAGANVNAKRDDGLTALMVASASQDHQTEVMELLLQAGAKVNESDLRDEMTPLLFALRDGDSLEKVELLLLNGASLAPPRRDGKTAEDFARAAGKDLRGLLQSMNKQCMVQITQLTTSYHAEETIRGKLLFSTLFDLGTVSFTVQCKWRPINSQEWRSAHTEAYSGSVEISANQKRKVPFELHAPAGPFSHEQGHRVNDWQLEVALSSPENITLAQSGQSEFTISRPIEAVVGSIPKRDKEIEREALSRITQKRDPSMGEHTFTHEDYQIRLVMERDSYQIGETLRGVVLIDSRAKVSCTKHEITLQQQVIDTRTGERSTIATLIPEIEFESPWYKESLAWPKEGQTRCIFSMRLPVVSPSYAGKRFQIEWVALFEAHIPWALNPTVYRKVVVSPAQETIEETTKEEPPSIWPKGADGAWYSRKKPTKKRWEELGARLSFYPTMMPRSTQGSLSLSLKPSQATQLKRITATLFGAEKVLTESHFETPVQGIWRQDARQLSAAISLSEGQALVLEERFLIPPDAPASFTSPHWCFSWWVLVEISFMAEDPIQVAIELNVLPMMGVGAPFRS